MSKLNEMVKRSEETKRIMVFKGAPNSIVISIEVASGKGYESYIDKNGCRRIEAWLHLRRPISADECAEFKCIIDNNDIEHDDIKHGDVYDYHLSCFPKSWLEDIWPKLVYTIDNNTEAKRMKACSKFECKEYEITCTSCKNTYCTCNPNCAKCKRFNNNCTGSMNYWSSYC